MRSDEKVISRHACDVSFIQKGRDGWVVAITSEEQLTSKFQGKTNEGYVSGEEVEDFGPVPVGTPNILHFLRQNQQPIVELWAVIIIQHFPGEFCSPEVS